MAASDAQTADYKERYVAFLDLLGFTRHVEAAESDPAVRDQLHGVLALVQETLCENPNLGMRLTYFSDCLVISADRTPSGLWEMFQSIQILTCNLLQHDVLLRGGLACGGCHHSAHMVYGVGMNRAYRLECTQAVHPLTLLALDVLDDAKRYGADFMQWLLEDGTNRYFVHYLRSYAEYREHPIYSGKVILDRPAARIINFARRRLNRDVGRVREKAEWFSNYWNRTVASQGVFGGIEPGPFEFSDAGGPTIMIRRIAGPGRPS